MPLILTQVREEDGRIRNDAAVNSGNVLAAAAELAVELADLSGAEALFLEAAEAYRTALGQEEDADVSKFSNRCFEIVSFPCRFQVARC